MEPVPQPTLNSGQHADKRRWQLLSTSDLQLQLPQYDIVALLGCGGMGAVYKARHSTLDRWVAIKILPPELLEDDPDNDLHTSERFLREARAMAQLSHPNIINVYDFGKTSAGLCYFVMEFVEGTDLAQYLKLEGGRLAPEEAVEIICKVLDALGVAHDAGIIHRDIKPANIMLDAKGRVKVADFGLAKPVDHESAALTLSYMTVGTPDFLAPECTIQGIVVDQRADIFAVGVTLYQLLTGKSPRGVFQPVSQLVADADPRLDAIVTRALQHDRDLRYTTAAEMRAALDALRAPVQVTSPVSTSAPVAAASSSATQSAVGSPPRSRRLILLASALVIAVVGLLWGLVGRTGKSHGGSEAPAASSSATAIAPQGTSASPQPGVWFKVNPDEKMIQGSKGFTLLPGGAINCKGGGSFTIPHVHARDVALRMDIRMHAGSDNLSLATRRDLSATSSWSGLMIILNSRHDATFSTQDNVNDAKAIRTNYIKKTTLPPGTLEVEQWTSVEFATVDTLLVATINGVRLSSQSNLYPNPGLASLSSRDGDFRNIQVMILDGVPRDQWPEFVKQASQSAPVASAAPPSVAKLTPDQQKADAIWRSRWGKPGRLHLAQNGIATPMSLAKAEPYSDFVQVGLVVGGLSGSGTQVTRWMALRSNGELVGSDEVPSGRGWIGMVPSSATSPKRDVYIREGGMAVMDGKPLASEPMIQVKMTDMRPLLPADSQTTSVVNAFQKADGTWMVEGKVFDAGLLARPDLTSAPAVQDVILNSYGVGVLRTDGSLRFYQKQEKPLPAEVSRGVRAVRTAGSLWYFLLSDGRVPMTKLAREDGTPLESITEVLPAFTSVSAIYEAGYNCLIRRKDGSFNTNSTKTFERDLNQARPEGFAIKMGLPGSALLWIEPQ